MNDTPAVVTDPTECDVLLAAKAQQNQQRSKENRQRILTLEQTLTRQVQRREEIDDRLEQHGKTLQAHGNTLAAVRTVADKAHADVAGHEMDHTKIYNNNYAGHANRLAILEAEVTGFKQIVAESGVLNNPPATPPPPGPAGDGQATQDQRLHLLEKNFVDFAALMAAIAKKVGISVSVTVPGRPEHN